MPIYEYECVVCDFKDEILTSSDKPNLFCPKCDHLTFKKIISKSNFVLKGEGWYKK